MEYKYSTVIDPATYETHGLCEGIPLRCHESPELEEIETLRCQEDWRRWVGPLGFYKGGLGPRWNFMAITVPECLPERLGVLGYANELAFLHDGKQRRPTKPVLSSTNTQSYAQTSPMLPKLYVRRKLRIEHEADIAQGDLHNNDLMTSFEQAAKTGNIEDSASGKRAIQAKIAMDMMALNKEHAITTLKAWAKFAELGSGRQHQTHFKTEAEYIEYRMIDIGTM